MSEGDNILKINIEEQMRTAYIDYSMSVIVARALPDVRDGLKPVHRRVLYGMNELGINSSKPYKKSARIVGEVLGKYHPHGDSSVYFSMVRMAQNWSLRYPLIDGQGNYGSVDGDNPAAMRYTEARLRKIAEDTMTDLEKDTVDFRNNFDDSLQEPTVLPTKIPNLLVNGSSGIAVGMATNIPPHNLGNVIDACVAYIDNNEIEVSALIELVQAPDFPTGGTIYGYQGVKDAYETGRGRIVVRGKVEIETSNNNQEKLIISEIPYLVNKAELIQKIAQLVNEKKIEGISNVNDESDRDGMRIVVDVKRGAIPNVVLNTLYKQTALQSSFSVNSIALVNGRPQLLTLKDFLHHFVAHRHEVLVRRTKYDLKQAEARLHILEGLIIASDNIDEVIRIIRSADNPEKAIAELRSRFNLSAIQAQAIVDMRLRQLTKLNQDKLRSEHAEIVERIAYFNRILSEEPLRMSIIKEELLEVKEKYSDERRTEIQLDAEEFNPEDFYADEDVVITVSHLGYIKRTLLSEFKQQNRGGVGAKGSSTRNEDFIEHIFVASMHKTLLLFTQNGRCFWLKVYEVPEGTKTSKGRAIQNLLNIGSEDKVVAYLNVKTLKEEEYINNHSIVMCTKKGVIKKTLLEAYSRPRANGVNAITIREEDQLLEVILCHDGGELMLAKKLGKSVRFPLSKVRNIGRTASGVRGVTLESEEDEVIGMVFTENNESEVLVISEKGYGKRSLVSEYRITNRGGKGVRTMNVSEKTGKVIALKVASNDKDLLIINESGITIRLGVENIKISGRNTQGVRLLKIRDKDCIASVAVVNKGEEDESEE